MAAAARTQARSPGAARALLVTLAALWALRALAIFAPGRYLWGLDLGRDLAPVAVWTAWGLAALTLLPALSRPLAERIPGGARAGATIAIVLALGAGAWMATHPDRVRFTGDSDLRGESILSVANPDQFLPQAMPGDRWLHVSMPLLMRAKGVPPSIYNHALGALLATLSVLIAWRLSRVLDLRGAAALGVMVVAASTGAFALYGGYAKGSVELVVLTFAAGVSAVAIARGREGPLPLALLVSAGICMHRAGLTLLPLWLAALAGELATRRAAALRHADLWLALAAPVAMLAWLGPRLVRVARTFDASHHLADRSHGVAGALGYAFAPAHLRDVANVLLLLVPLAPALLVLRAHRTGERPAHASREALLLAAATLPWIVLLLVMRPQQGLFRDWDVFAGAGTLLAVVLAVRVGALFERAPSAVWLAVPLALMSAIPALQWVAIQHEETRGLERVWQQLEGPPLGDPESRARGFSSLSLHYFGSDWNRYAAACSLSLEAAPNPSVYVQWGMAKTMLAQYAQAQTAYLHAAQLNPNLPLAWRGVAASSSALGDIPHMQEAVAHLRVMEPDGATTRDAIEYLQRYAAQGREPNRPAHGRP